MATLANKTLFDTSGFREKQELLRQIRNESDFISLWIQAINVLKTELASCTQLSQLHGITQKVIAKSKQVADFVNKKTKNNDPELLAAIEKEAEKESCCRHFLELLNFYDEIALIITQTKERITLNKALITLTDAQQKQLLETIASIKSLSAVVVSMEKDKNELQVGLELAVSSAAIDDLHKRIVSLDDIYKVLYKTVVIVPSDEVVLQATKDLLKENSHLHALLAGSDFEDALTDNMLHATARMGM